MTLDEHIAKAEEEAKVAEFDTEWGIGNYFIDRTEALEYAKECKNLANWLKDYKRLLEQEPCEDCISRQAVLDVVSNPLNIRLEEIIKKLPSVNPKEKAGHWIETGNKGHIDVDSTILYQEMCDKCKGLSYFRKSCGKLVGAEYCPNCMAKMEREVSE